MATARSMLLRALPAPLVRLLRERRSRRNWRDYLQLSTREVFTRIYEEGTWGQADSSDDPFHSGSGSRAEAVVAPYVAALRGFLSSLPVPPDVVDLGCGDFNVGRQLRAVCGRYVACDIVTPLIERNRGRYAGLDVDFRVLDLTRDELPAGEVVFVRQVLQHLSNDDIRRALPRIAATYRYAVITEHIPAERDFLANVDKPTGPGIRLESRSGVVLTQPPFDLAPRRTRILCEVPESGGLVRTLVYEL